PRWNGVASDAPRPVLRRHRFGQSHDPGFCGAVGGSYATTDDALDRRGADDRAAPAREHVRDRVLAAHDMSLEVDGDESVEELHVEIDDIHVECVGRRVGSVVVEHVKAAEGLDGGLDHADDARLVGDVDLDGNRAPKLSSNSFGGGAVDVGYDNRGALARHDPGGCLADAAASAGHDRDFPLEASHGARSMAGPLIRPEPRA